MSVSDKCPRKGLKVVHVNICSIRNREQDIDNLLTSNNIDLLANPETHLNDSFDTAALAIQGTKIYKRDLWRRPMEDYIIKCYRPPSSRSEYLDHLCELLDRVGEVSREIYSVGGLGPYSQSILRLEVAPNLLI